MRILVKLLAHGRCRSTPRGHCPEQFCEPRGVVGRTMSPIQMGYHCLQASKSTRRVEVIRRIMNRSTIVISETATISKALTGSVCPSGAVAYHSMSGIWWSLASSPCCQSARTRSHRCSAIIPQASAASASLTSAAGSLIACAMNRSMTAAGRAGR